MSATEPREITGQENAAQVGWLAAILDLMPTPILLVELGTARVTFANRAADRLAGGRFPRGFPGEEHHDAYHCTDAQGRRIPNDEMPGVRAARGERLDNFEMDWHTPQGVRSLLISTDIMPALFGHPETAICAFEDVTELKEGGKDSARHVQASERLYEDARAAQARSVEALALVDTLFHTAPVGFAYLDGELRYVRVNEALAAMNGVPASEHIGRTVAEVLPVLGEEMLGVLRNVLETGEALIDLEVSLPAGTGVAGTRQWLGSFYPVRDVDGTTLGLGAVVSETTERKRADEARERALVAERAARRRAEEAERRARFLAEAGALLSESLDYEETLGRLATLAVPERAQWCAIDMLGPEGAVERVALAHADPDRARHGWELSRRWPVTMEDADGVARVLRTGLSLLYREVTEDVLESIAQDPEHLRALREMELRSCMIVPLRIRGRVLGALSFLNDSGGGAFGEEELEVAEDLAARAAVAVENARLYSSRSAIARTLQESLLPPHLPTIEGLELAARYRAAGDGNEVGGDFYDVFAVGERCWALVIGDVCGKGAEAAALTALMRYTLRAAAMAEQSPSAVLRVLNEAILRQRTDNRFCTAVFARVELRDDGVHVCVACGGHPPPLVVRAAGATESVGTSGTLLGVLPEVTHVDCEAELAPGDALLLFTDGLVEAGGAKRVMSPESLCELAASCAGLAPEEIARRVEEHALALQNGIPRDDLAVLVAGVPSR